MGQSRFLLAVTTVPALALAIVVSLAACSGRTHVRTPQAAGPFVEVVQTDASLSQHLTRLAEARFSKTSVGALPTIRVDDHVRYQRIVGVGVAITDSTAWLIHDELAPAARATLLGRLFGARGIHLTAVRVPIGASDFTKNGKPYSYDDVPPGQVDPSLSHFSIAHDEPYILPTLRQILALDPEVEVIASPWSPPAWMKANRSLGNAGGAGALLPGAYESFARYVVKFLQAYASHGVTVEAITAQNEPGQQSLYPGLNLSASDEATFVSRYLAPALRRAGLHTRIYGHDWKWLLWQRARALISNPQARAALAGLAWHCYSGNPSVMTLLHRIAPRLDQIESECATGGAPGPPAELVIASVRNWASTVLLWNAVLDSGNGPVQPPNDGCPYCTPVITVDVHTHAITYRSDYFELGQFSAFVQPGARRVDSNTFVSYNTPDRHHRINYATAGVDDVAVVNPDGGRVLMAHNNASAADRFAVRWHGMAFSYTLPPRATVTFVWR
jgi:glucosylceramidase